MFRSHRGWIAGLLALATSAALAPGAQATAHKHIRRHKPVVAHYHATPRGSINDSTYLDVGAVPETGSTQRYFNDTKDPGYLVGPGYFQRWQ